MIAAREGGPAGSRGHRHPEQISEDGRGEISCQRAQRGTASGSGENSGCLVEVGGEPASRKVRPGAGSAQIPTRIVELTADDIVTDNTGTHLILHTVPVLIPPPLASLTAELLEENEQQQQLRSPDAPVWLFPVKQHQGAGDPKRQVQIALA